MFHIEDNGYAISVPIDDQVSGASVYNISSGYQNLNRYNVDGTDFLETHLAFKDAVNRARNGKGPSVVVSNVVRLLPHSSSDDHRKYRSKEELDMDMERDPINKFKALCIDNGICKIQNLIRLILLYLKRLTVLLKRQSWQAAHLSLLYITISTQKTRILIAA